MKLLGRFLRNSCLRYWMDHPRVSRNDLYWYCKVLADNAEFPWANKLNSQARQAAAERAWSNNYSLKVSLEGGGFRPIS